MKCKLVKMEDLSGSEASIYSMMINDDTFTQFDSFIHENISMYKSEILHIIKRLRTIGSKTGAREQFFKLNEGNPGDGVCALYDEPDKKLRLYCIRYAKSTIILGGGGEKPPGIRKLQDSRKLKDENYLLRELSSELTKRIKAKDIKLDYATNDLEGMLNFNTDEE